MCNKHASSFIHKTSGQIESIFKVVFVFKTNSVRYRTNDSTIG